MTLGNKLLIIFFLLISFKMSNAEEILSSPLINLNELKPSFEELEDNNESNISKKDIKKLKKKKSISSNYLMLYLLD